MHYGYVAVIGERGGAKYSNVLRNTCKNDFHPIYEGKHGKKIILKKSIRKIENSLPYMVILSS